MSNYIDNIVKNAVTYDLVSKPLADDMANEFSIQSTYAVGDYVMHDYKLYKCISAVTTAGNWNSAKWQECKIGDEINGGVKFTAQTLTSEQKAQARNNIGAISQEEATPDAIKYSAQSLTDAQKNQARVNVGTVASTSIAEEFSTSKAYAVGDLVMYDSKLYKFKTVHSAGAWNVAQVDAVSVKEEISSLSNDLSDLQNEVEYKTIFAKDYELALVITAYIAANPTRNHIRTDLETTKSLYIPCFPNTVYTITKQVSARYRVGYTSEIPKHGLTVYGLGDNATATTLMVNTGSDAKYLVVFYYMSTVDTSTESEILESISISGLFKKDLDSHLSDVGSHPFGTTIYAKNDDFVTAITGYIASNPNRDHFRTDVVNSRSIYVPCYPNATYTITKKLSARYRVGYTTQFPEHGVSIYDIKDDASVNTLSVSTGSDAKYLVVFYYLGTYDTDPENEIRESIEITGLFPTAVDRYFRGAYNWNLLNNVVYATPQQYGAIGDGVNDDTTAINNCLSENQFVIIPEGMYRITDTIKPYIVNRSTVICSDKAMFIADSTAFNAAIQNASAVSDRPSMLLLQQWVGWNQFGLTWFGGVFNCNNVTGLIGVKVTNRVGFYAMVPKLFVCNLGTDGVGFLITGIASSAIKLGQIVIYANDIDVSQNGNWTSSDSGAWKDAIGFYDISSHDYSIDTLYIVNCITGIYNDGGDVVHVNYYHYWAGSSASSKFTESDYQKTRAFYSTDGKWHFDYFYSDFAYIAAECNTITCGHTHFIGINKNNITGIDASEVNGYLLKPTDGNGIYDLGIVTKQEAVQDCKFDGVYITESTASLVAISLRNIIRFNPGNRLSYKAFANTIFGSFSGNSCTVEGNWVSNTYYVLGYVYSKARQIHVDISTVSGDLLGEFDIAVTNSSIAYKNVKSNRQVNAVYTLAFGSTQKTISNGLFYPVLMKRSASINGQIVTVDVPTKCLFITAGDGVVYSGNVTNETAFEDADI